MARVSGARGGGLDAHRQKRERAGVKLIDTADTYSADVPQEHERSGVHRWMRARGVCIKNT
jgi:aryl-alcohol dehydrogenase-like predicted oxidoreductase